MQKPTAKHQVDPGELNRRVEGCKKGVGARGVKYTKRTKTKELTKQVS